MCLYGVDKKRVVTSAGIGYKVYDLRRNKPYNRHYPAHSDKPVPLRRWMEADPKPDISGDISVDIGEGVSYIPYFHIYRYLNDARRQANRGGRYKQLTSAVYEVKYKSVSATGYEEYVHGDYQVTKMPVIVAKKMLVLRRVA